MAVIIGFLGNSLYFYNSLELTYEESVFPAKSSLLFQGWKLQDSKIVSFYWNTDFIKINLKYEIIQNISLCKQVVKYLHQYPLHDTQ